VRNSQFTKISDKLKFVGHFPKTGEQHMKDVQQINWPMLPTLSPGTAAAMVQPLRWLVGAADWALTLPMHRRKRISDSQIWLITEKEIITNIQNLKSPAAFLLMAILILISFFLMSADYQKRMDNWSNNQVAQKDKLFSGMTSSYRSTESMMMNARGIPREPLLRRPLPLSMFAKGLDSVMERSVTIGDNSVVPVATSFTLGTTQERNRNLLLFAPPDYLYVIKIILSLLAMFFTYDALVGERESGTLKAMLSGAVRRRTILVGKWFGASISIIVPFLFATGIGFAYLVFAYEGWTSVHVDGPVNHVPVLSVSNTNVSATAGQTVQLSSYLSATDADGDSLVYVFYDSTVGGGRIYANGVAQPEGNGQMFGVAASQLSQTTFVAGASGDDILVGVTDGKSFSGWTSVHIGPPVNHAPVVYVSDQTWSGGASVPVTKLFLVSDADGNAMTAYQFQDGNANAASGHFVVNGVAQAANQTIDVTPSQLAQTTFLAGHNTVDHLMVRAFDGTTWSDWKQFDLTSLA